jgi:hypothetical protein
MPFIGTMGYQHLAQAMYISQTETSFTQSL